jgi:hypothetical protein
VREALRRVQIGLLELQPGEVLDLDDRVARPGRPVSPDRTLLTVQVFVRGLLRCVIHD